MPQLSASSATWATQTDPDQPFAGVAGDRSRSGPAPRPLRTWNDGNDPHALGPGATAAPTVRWRQPLAGPQLPGATRSGNPRRLDGGSMGAAQDVPRVAGGPARAAGAAGAGATHLPLRR